MIDFMQTEAPPLRKLPVAFSEYEAIIAKLPEIITEKRITDLVDKAPSFPTKNLSTILEWERAYLILTFISQALVVCEKINVFCFKLENPDQTERAFTDCFKYIRFKTNDLLFFSGIV